jgi:hypothetical protein
LSSEPDSTHNPPYASTVTGRPLTKAETADLLRQLQRTLAVVAADELDASALTRARLEGAVAAVEVVLGERSTFDG